MCSLVLNQFFYRMGRYDMYNDMPPPHDNVVIVGEQSEQQAEERAEYEAWLDSISSSKEADETESAEATEEIAAPEQPTAETSETSLVTQQDKGKAVNNYANTLGDGNDILKEKQAQEDALKADEATSQPQAVQNPPPDKVQGQEPPSSHTEEVYGPSGDGYDHIGGSSGESDKEFAESYVEGLGTKEDSGHDYYSGYSM